MKNAVMLPMQRERLAGLTVDLAEPRRAGELVELHPHWYGGGDTNLRRLLLDLEDLKATKGLDKRWRIATTQELPPAPKPDPVKVELPATKLVVRAPAPPVEPPPPIDPPKAEPAAPAAEKEPVMQKRRTGTPGPEERQPQLRALLESGPKSNGEIADAISFYGGGAGIALLRSDATAIGATRAGNRLAPWTLPGVEAPVAAPKVEGRRVAPAQASSPETTPATLDLQTVSTAQLVEELGRRARLVDAVRAAIGTR